MDDGRASRSPIVVRTDSEVAKWAQGLSQDRATAVEAIEVEGRPRSLFAANQILVDSGEQALVAELIDRYAAKVIPRRPLLPPPPGAWSKGRAGD